MASRRQLSIHSFLILALWVEVVGKQEVNFQFILFWYPLVKSLRAKGVIVSFQFILFWYVRVSFAWARFLTPFNSFFSDTWATALELLHALRHLSIHSFLIHTHVNTCLHGETKHLSIHSFLIPKNVKVVAAGNPADSFNSFFSDTYCPAMRLGYHRS